MKRLLLYMGRWQLSTPILAIVPKLLIKCGIIHIIGTGGLSNWDWWLSAIITNIIGALLLYQVDKKIFKKN